MRDKANMRSFAPLFLLFIVFQVPLATDAQFDYTEPTVSPNGKYLAYCSNKTGKNAIYISGVDGKDERLLIDLEGYESTPNWSPDGKRIVFYLMDENGSSDMYLIDRNGENLKKINNKELQNPGIVHWVNNGEIVFSSGDYPENNIFTLDLSTHNLTQITHETGLNYYADIFEDKMVFSKLSREGKGIYLMDLNTGLIKQLTQQGEAPVFANRGTTVLYQGKNDEGITNLRKIDLKENTNVALTNFEDLCELPEVEDKQEFVYYQRKVGGKYEIWRVGLDGTKNQKIIGN